MASAQVTVVVETGADFAAMLNTEAVDLSQGGRGVGTVEVGEENLLLWSVAGDPGAKYKITLGVKGNRKIVMTRGRNPESSFISTRKLRGGGSSCFKVVAGDAP